VNRPSRVVFTAHGEDKAQQLRCSLVDIAEVVLSNHERRRRNPGEADWIVSGSGLAVVYNWPAWLVLEGFDGQHAYGEEHPWGLIERDRETGQIVSIEFWRASEQLPKEVLDALPAPRSTGAVIDSSELAKHHTA